MGRVSTLLGPEATGLRGRVTFDGYGSLVGSSYRFAHLAVSLLLGGWWLVGCVGVGWAWWPAGPSVA